MLEWLADQHEKPAFQAAAEDLHRAVETVLRDGPRTLDLGGVASTDQIRDALIAALQPAAVVA